MSIAVAPGVLPSASADPAECPIPPPQDVTEHREGSGILIDWEPPLFANTWQITHYEIYRSPETITGLNFEFLAEVDAPSTLYFDSPVPAFEEFAYMITALGFCGEGLPSPPTIGYPYCEPLVMMDDPSQPGGVRLETRPACVMPPPV